MSIASEPEQLRARARAIRRTAGALDDCAATRLLPRAGEDTWIGPTPQRCHDDLDRLRTVIRGVHDELIVTARSLETQADLLAAGAGGGTRVTVS